MKLRKQRTIRMSTPFLAKVLAQYGVVLPDDAQIIGVRMDPFTDSIELLVCSEAFAVVPEGAVPVRDSLLSCSEASA